MWGIQGMAVLHSEGYVVLLQMLVFVRMSDTLQSCMQGRRVWHS